MRSKAKKILKLTIKKKWFDMIKSGEKKEEYREIKPYWTARLNHNFRYVKFYNGAYYSDKIPNFTVELLAIKTGTGKKEWGAREGKLYFVLKLGRRID